MPTYTFQTPSGDKVTRRLSFSEYDAIKAGEVTLTADTGEPLELVFEASQVRFTMKDGQSGGWASKALKENQYRQERSQEMTRREREHVKPNRLIPNYGGKEANSWSDVQDHVRSEKGAVAASSYNQLVTSESKKASK